MKPLLAARVRDQRRAVQSGGGGGTPGSSALKWNPGVRVALSSPTTFSVPASTTNNNTIHTITLSDGQHGRIVLPTGEPRNGPIQINGTTGTNNRIWITGGQIKMAPTSTFWALQIQGVDHIYLEGLRIDKQHGVGSALRIGRRINATIGPMLWMQNCLFTGINYADTANGDWTTQHGDYLIWISPNGQGLRMYRCSMWYWNTGAVGQDTGNAAQGFEFYDCDFNIYDSRYNPKATIYNPLGFATGNSPAHCNWFLGCGVSRVVTDNVYFWDHQPVGTFQFERQNSSGVGTGVFDTHTKRSLLCQTSWGTCVNSGSTCNPSVSGDAYAGTMSFPSLPQVTGVVRGGIPPNGHFVNSGTVQYSSQQWPNATAPVHSGAFDGLNYPQPGTAGHPGYQE